LLLKADRFIEVQSFGLAYEAPCNENHKYVEVMINFVFIFGLMAYSWITGNYVFGRKLSADILYITVQAV